MELKGQIKDIIYQNEVNSYTIAVLETKEEELTVVGYLPFINSGDTLNLIGKFITHQEYGRQFKIDTFEKVMPDTLEGLEKYLSNGIIKGIGPSTAKKIIDMFGEETVNVLKYEPKKLSKIRGISEKKAQEMSESFNENWNLWQIVGFLEKFSIGPNNAKKIYKTLGNNAIEEIKKDPYILLEIVRGVDFKQIDKIAIELGVAFDNERRVKSGIKYSLVLSSYNGHSCVLKEKVIDFVSNLLEVDEQNVINGIINLNINQDIIIEKRDDEEWIYLYSFYKAELNIAEKIKILQNSKNIKKIKKIDSELKKLEKSSCIVLSEKQKEAIREVNENNVCIITGGPGTGKTTIIKTIIEMYKIHGKKTLLCAPTGRAAKKMTETTGQEAKTLHRLLEIGKIEEEGNSINTEFEISPLDCDVIIIDEVSMVDLFLMNYLVKALYQGTKLVLVGDVDQLPSVGPGSVLKDLIESNTVKTVILDKIFRQAAKSKIILNAHNVNNGEKFLTENSQETNQDFFFIKENIQERMLAQIISLCNGRLQNFGNYDFFNNMQVLTPTKKGILGTKELNKSLQNAMNPKSNLKKEKISGSITYREGDKVMQIKNNYDLFWEKHEPEYENGTGVFNGELGRIEKIDDVEKYIKIKFDDGKITWYPFSELDQIEHSYSITIHKAQRK